MGKPLCGCSRFNFNDDEVDRIRYLLTLEDMTPSLIAKRYGCSTRAITYYREPGPLPSPGVPQAPRSSQAPFDLVAPALGLVVERRCTAAVTPETPETPETPDVPSQLDDAVVTEPADLHRVVAGACALPAAALQVTDVSPEPRHQARRRTDRPAAEPAAGVQPAEPEP